MKKVFILACVAMLTACSQQPEADKAVELKLESETSRLSYAIGMDVGMSLKTLESDLDRAALMAAINDRLDGNEMRLSQEDSSTIKKEFFMAQAKKKAEVDKAASEKNIADGAAFLAENAKKEGVTVTASGLQYQVITKGDGPKPVLEDSVKVHYVGTGIDGSEFDSSIARGQPITFPLGNVIKGWQEGVQLMNVGSKYRFVIPSEIAYGERAAGAKIGPNSVLVFEVELLGIEGKTTDKAAAKG